MQILNKRVLTQAVVGSTLLLAGTGAFAAATDITGDNSGLVNGAQTNINAGATLNIDETQGTPFTIKASGGSLVMNAGINVVTATLANNAAGAVALTIENSSTAKAAEITASGIGHGITFVNANAGKLFTATLTLNTGSIIEATGSGNVVHNAAGEVSNLTIANSGTIRNTGTGNAIRIDSANATLNTLTNSGTISAVGANAIDINAAAAVTNPFVNTGTVSSTSGSAIKNRSVNMVLTQNSGSMTGKNTVIDFTGKASDVNINGGSVIATDGAAANAITTNGAVTIGGNNVSIQGIILTGGAINVNPGAGNSFTTNGNLSAAGGTTVNSGTLNLRNNVINGNLTVAAAGTVNVNANQTVAGNLAITGGAKGVFDLVNSNLAAANGTALAASAFGQLAVAGTSDISNGVINVTNAGNGYIANGTVFPIIASTGALTSANVVLNVPNGSTTAVNNGSVGVYTYAAAVAGNNVNVTVTRRALNTFGNADENRLIGGVGAALESIGAASTVFGAVNNADLMRLLGELGRLPTQAAVADALRQLVPPTNQMTMQAAIQSSNHALDVVNSRLSLAQADMDEAGYAAGDSASGQSVWGQVFGSHSDQRRRQSIFGYKSDTAGLALGTDMMVSDMVRLGMAVSYASADSKTKSTPRNDVDTKSYNFTLYGAYDMGCGWWDGMLSYGTSRHKGTRRVSFGGINAIASNNHRGSQWSARVGYGYPFTSDNGWDVIPSTSLTWNHVTERAYTERNAAGLDLRVNSHNVDRVELGADVKFAYPMDVDSGKFIPDFHLGANYAVKNQRESLTAAFVAGGPSFRVIGMKPASFGVDAGVGLNLLTKNDVSFGVNYDANFKKNFFSHSGFLTVRYAL